ncbi:protein transport protein Sec23A [Pycnococcus provasolii]|uniref:Protein transport protein SEC23 n=1 Tax=Pycnococcus provasolii TaxID=41880 RepID=A0A830HR97_9CHLO|nr:protein transport protein Sec23A [Pycnococcus provasolii]
MSVLPVTVRDVRDDVHDVVGVGVGVGVGASSDLSDLLPPLVEQQNQNQNHNLPPSSLSKVTSFVRLSCTRVPCSANFTNTSGIPLGVIVTPSNLFAEQAGGTASAVHIARPPILCAHCGACSSPFSRVDAHSGTWVCALCVRANKPAPDYVADARACLELSHASIEYTVETPPANAVPPTSSPTTSHQPATVVFLIDETLPPKALADVRHAVLMAAEAMPASSRVSLITFGRCVTVFHVGAEHETDDAVAPCIATALPAAASTTNGDAADNTTTSSFSTLTSLVEELGGVAPLVAPVRTRLGEFRRAVRAVRSRPDTAARSLGAAVEASLALFAATADGVANAVGSPRRRIVTFVGGPCSDSDPNLQAAMHEGQEEEPEAALTSVREAQARVASLARACVAARCPVDLLPVGPNVHMGVAEIWSPLCEVTGGMLAPPRRSAEDAAALSSDAVACAARAADGSGGVVDIRVSPPARVVHIMGAGVAVGGRGAALAASSATGGRPPPSSAAMWQLDAPPGGCLAATIALNGDIAPGGGIVVQVTYTRRLPSGGWSARVTTQRIAATTDDDEFIGSVDTEAAASLVAKGAASLAKSHELAGAGGVLAESGDEAVAARMEAVAESLGKSFGAVASSDTTAQPRQGWFNSLIAAIAPPGAPRLRAVPAVFAPILETAWRIANAGPIADPEMAACMRRLVLRSEPELALRYAPTCDGGEARQRAWLAERGVILAERTLQASQTRSPSAFLPPPPTVPMEAPAAVQPPMHARGEP